ncbi:hypothetical protein UK15_32565 [Streptomyces variegatus]|uniref:Uncharacterized protein n=1 Tax=Streptomyces variegatus TaxID=284040 RepID=A0A0M2GJC7_9ACTN|nr:hypothetical protein UK15_32565 [Streptomyces variegatus]
MQTEQRTGGLRQRRGASHCRLRRDSYPSQGAGARVLHQVQLSRQLDRPARAADARQVGQQLSCLVLHGGQSVPSP